jgi:hypothetical protein
MRSASDGYAFLLCQLRRQIAWLSTNPPMSPTSTAWTSYSRSSRTEDLRCGKAICRGGARALEAARSSSALHRAGNTAMSVAAAAQKADDGGRTILNVHAGPGRALQRSLSGEVGGGAGVPGQNYLCIMRSVDLVSLILCRVYLLWGSGQARGPGRCVPPAYGARVAGREPPMPWPHAC